MKKLSIIILALALILLLTACVPHDLVSRVEDLETEVARLVSVREAIESMIELRQEELELAIELAREESIALELQIEELEALLENIDDPDVQRRIAEEVLGLVSPDDD
ncbi:MAG: hypothetical protein FWD05_11570 [Oscillospiraceae bacterium]|nr:hypothetical protein [Oscillospiraceae bacterium]